LHFSLSIVTHPVAASFTIAFLRHASMQAGFLQLRQMYGIISPSITSLFMDILARAGSGAFSFSMEQAIWQSSQPVQ
jgi:hypothetical protein